MFDKIVKSAQEYLKESAPTRRTAPLNNLKQSLTGEQQEIVNQIVAQVDNFVSNEKEESAASLTKENILGVLNSTLNCRLNIHKGEIKPTTFYAAGNYDGDPSKVIKTFLDKNYDNGIAQDVQNQFKITKQTPCINMREIKEGLASYGTFKDQLITSGIEEKISEDLVFLALRPVISAINVVAQQALIEQRSDILSSDKLMGTDDEQQARINQRVNSETGRETCILGIYCNEQKPFLERADQGSGLPGMQVVINQEGELLATRQPDKNEWQKTELGQATLPRTTWQERVTSQQQNTLTK